MATEILMEKLEGGLHPVDDDGIKAMRAVEENKIVKIKLSIPRNVAYHRFLFALLKVVYDAQREPKVFATTEKLLDALKIGTGYVREVRDFQGNTHVVPDSIAFGRMDEIQFREWMEQVKDLILRWVLPRVEKADFNRQISEMLRITGPEER